MKKWISTIMVIAVLALICTPAFAEMFEIPDSGQCGETLSYQITGENFDYLTIRGAGEMWDYGWEHVTEWPEWIKTVVFEEGVENVGKSAFLEINLTSVKIAGSVKKIGDYAFSTCTLLPKVIIPEGTQYIGKKAFEDCRVLSYMQIPNSVTYIAEDAFYKSDKVVIYGYAGSYAEQYANEHRIPFVALQQYNDAQHITLQIGNFDMYVGNDVVKNDVTPEIVNGRTMVPIRVVTEVLGGKADWNAATQAITLSINGKVLHMTIGQMLSGFDAAPVILNSRTYVPIRYVAEQLGAQVEWNAATQQIVIVR